MTPSTPATAPIPSPAISTIASNASSGPSPGAAAHAMAPLHRSTSGSAANSAPAAPAAAPALPAKKAKKLTYRKNGVNADWRKAAASVPKVHAATSWDIRMIGIGDIATGFLATFGKALDVLRNGRAFSAWGEEMCQAIGQVSLHPHRDVKGSDGLSPEGKKTSIKSLTSNRGLVFQMSVYTGAKRSCSMADLEHSVRDSPVHMVVDITDLSCIRFTALPAELLLDWMRAGLLTPAGFPTPDEFYELVSTTVASGQSIEVDSKALAENLREANAKAYEAWKAEQPERPALFGSVPAAASPKTLTEAATPQAPCQGSPVPCSRPPPHRSR